MRNYFYILLFAFASFVLKAGNADTLPSSTKDLIYRLENIREPVRVGKYFAFYEDKSGTMSFAEVQKQKEYTVKNIDIPNFNITTAAVWGKIEFTCVKAADWYLEIDPASFNEVVFYKQTNGKAWTLERVGNIYPADQRPLAVNHYLLKLDMVPGDTAVVYFRIQDYYPMQFDIKVSSLEAFFVASHNSDIFNGFCYGIMIMMLIYNFYLYITQKNIAYLYYVMYVFFNMVFSAYLGGYALHFPEPLLKLIRFAPIIPPAGFGIFGLLFTLKLFGGALRPGLKKTIYVFITIAVLDAIFSIFPSLVHLSENIIQPLGLGLGILCISSAIIALKKRQSGATYYLIGFGTYMLSLFYLILSAQGVFTATNFSWHALATGSAFESIMLSFALGDKVKVILKEKQKAQEDALLQATENARLVKEQNIILEQKVKERTQQLEERNKDILDSIRYARRIQTSLLPTEKYISRILNKLN